MTESYSSKMQTNHNHKAANAIKLVTRENYLKNGYSLIKRNPNTKKIEIIYSHNYDRITKELEQKKHKRGIETMINRWNIYRDDVNNFLGDLSPYINYRETIQKMVEEDNYILEEIHKHSNNNSHNDNDSDYNSENEDAKYLLS